MKHILLSVYFRIFLLVVAGVFLFVLWFGVSQDFVRPLSESVQKTKQFYSSSVRDFSIDEYFLLQHILRRTAWSGDVFDSLHARARNDFFKNPFSRILGFDVNRFSDLTFVRTDSVTNQSVLDTGSYNTSQFVYAYDLPRKYDEYLEDPWDRVLLKALYCNETGFLKEDFLLLFSLRDHEGGYADTHVLLGLLFLKERGCFDEGTINRSIYIVSHDVYQASVRDVVFSDLYVERLVFLSWAGRGDFIKKDQIVFVQKNQNTDGGWADVGEDQSNLHTTGLALLVLLYEQEGFVFGSESLF